MKLEHQPDGEVIKEAAVQDEGDEGSQSALSGRGGGFGSVGVQLTQDCKRRDDNGTRLRTSHFKTWTCLSSIKTSIHVP